MTLQPIEDAGLWEEAFEKTRREFEILEKPYELKRKEEAQLKAQQEAIEEKRQIELFLRNQHSHSPNSWPLKLLSASVAVNCSSTYALMSICRP